MIRGAWAAFALAGLFVPVQLAAQQAAASGRNSDLERELARIRQATDAYHDVEAARAAGYPPANQCLESDAGVMGYHHLNRDLLDDRLELERPEIVVYAPTEDGKRKLVNVEYVVPYSAWQQDEAPRILGHDLKRSDGLQIWYLHVWVWEENPNGVFADWNPALTCSP